jgi:sortase (surface protein transpeptidase)
MKNHLHKLFRKLKPAPKSDTGLAKTGLQISTRNILSCLGIAAIAILITAVIIIIVNEHRMNIENTDKPVPLPIPVEDGAGVVLPNNLTPEDEAQPTVDQMSAYAVANDKPRYLRIPALNIFARVVEIGSTDGQLGTPSNLHDVGWYFKSALPGEKGASLMDGHGGGGNNSTVVFDKLSDLNNGDKIEIEMGDGRKFTYHIVEKKILTVSEADAYMSTMLQVEGGATSGLNLVSCVGTWSLKEMQFDQRVMIRSVLEE